MAKIADRALAPAVLHPLQNGVANLGKKRMDIGIAHWPPYWFLPSCGLSTSKKHFRRSNSNVEWSMFNHRQSTDGLETLFRLVYLSEKF